MNRWIPCAVFVMSMCFHTDSPADSYRGMFPGNWYEEARRRIEDIRRNDVSIRVMNGETPVPGAEVSWRMTRHAFPFGSAVVARRLVDDDSPDGEPYRAAVTGLFNRVVFENDLKWPAWIGEWAPGHDRERTLEAVAWLRERDITIRGHCMVWPGWENLPKTVRQHRGNPDMIRRMVTDHISDLGESLNGRIAEWDVVNETYWNHNLQDMMGRGIMLEWFALARKAFPESALYINDARIVAFGGREFEHKEHYFKEVEYLTRHGADLDAVGFQCHFYEDSLTPPEDALAMLDRFGQFGLPLAITEFDIDTLDEDLQARYMFDFMHVMFSHPMVNQFMMWGFWAGDIFKEQRALFRKDWSVKPNGQVFKDLVFGSWWTEDAGVTDSNGTIGARGFLGDYDVTVMVEGSPRTVTRKLTRDQTTWVVQVQQTPTHTEE